MAHLTEITGQVIRPNDTDYDEARTVFYGNFDARPELIIRPADADDVARVVGEAARTGSELAVRAGGHSVAGHSTTEGGLLLDLRSLNSIDIDPGQRVAWVDAGLTAGEYTVAAAKHGLATGFGDTSTVGVAGLTLGGGVGLLSRRYGLTVDSLLAADVVTADGRVLRVDQDHEPDLFWAIRGGGGNFGVVTRLGFRLQEVDRVTGGMLILPATAEVVESVVAEAFAAPDELTVIANVVNCPPLPFLPQELHGQMVVILALAHCGTPEDGERVVARFRGLATPLADMVRVMSYPELFPPVPDYHPTAIGRNLFVDKVDHHLAGMVVETLTASDAEMRATQLRVLGGAVSRVPDDATAYAHRDQQIMVNLGVMYHGQEDRAARSEWLDRFAASVNAGTNASYVNFLNDEGPDRVRDAYPGATWDRLVAVKRQYDPSNVFRRNQNIPPTG